MKTLTSDLYLSKHELELLESELRILRSIRVRDALLIELALELGCRESELIRIKPEHFNPETQSVFIYGLKGSSNRDIPFLNKDLFNRAYQYALTCNGLLFDINSSRVRQIWYEVRPRQIKKSFHKLRHTFGRTRSLQFGRDIYVLQYLLGHKNIANTAIYTNEDFTPQSLRERLNESA